ncbi:biogenesis of lysosome-related organelles complex-1 subunit 2-domain-containing protein [Chytridium lagenaria]|nr:biogenesis of lysosome-related organelles complex-1 subunit 2-domain-containing protein [Chytridium lagenaria]
MEEQTSPSSRLQHPRRSSSLEAFHPNIIQCNDHERRLTDTLEDVLAPRASELVTSLVRSEILTASSDLKLLESLNHIARDRYVEFGDTASVMVHEVERLQASYDTIEPYLHQVTELERQVTSLETIADELDDYTKRLEETVRRRIAAASRA